MAKDDPSIPTWQKAPSQPSDTPEHDPEVVAEGLPAMQFTEVDEMPPIPSLEEAKAFLDHPGTKQASPVDKIRFLELKNVQRKDIEALIPEAKSYYIKEDEKERKALGAESSGQAIPPVVTYPEFLVKSSKPPPLVTSSFLLSTLYATAGAFAGMYGLSKYVLSPMHQTLSEARHDFFTHAGTKVDEMNGRMSKFVTIPATKALVKKKDAEDDDNASVASDASDPTELFHRDIGVQTSPSLSRNQSSWSLSDTDPSTSESLAHQEARIGSITSILRDIRFSRDSSGNKEKEVSAQIDAYTKYLGDLMYSTPPYKYQNSFPTWNSTSTAINSNDEIDKFKNEIRSMKGAMLSTRNFPRGGT